MENEVRQIQLKCLEILRCVDTICRRHNIAYSLCGGSVVGAHLYGKCLPWDDDIDLMMTRENYNRFLSVAKEELPVGFSIHNYTLSDDFTTTFTKIMNDNTTVVQQDETVSGVFLDITVYDRLPNDFRKQIVILLWKLSQIAMIGTTGSVGIKNRIRNLLLKTILKDKRAYLCFAQKRVERLGKCRNYSYAEVFGAYCNTKPFVSEIFENYTEIAFEGDNYEIVRDYVRYLETRYDRTDFYEPPEKQIAPHYKFVDLKKPYRTYLGGLSHNTGNQCNCTCL